MKDDSLSDVQAMINQYKSGTYKDVDAAFEELNQYKCTDSVGKQDNVYAKQIWNDAIEAAAEKANAHMGKDVSIAALIRGLKK